MVVYTPHKRLAVSAMPAAVLPYSRSFEGVVAMNKATAADALFEHAPPNRVQRRLGLIKPDNLNVNRRALLFALICWLPLVLLAIVDSAVTHTDTVTSLFWQIGLHARYLIAVPLLVLAEAACVPQLNAIVRHFVDSGIVSERDRRKFEGAVASTRGLLQSSTVEFVVIALAYLVVLATVLSHSLDQLPIWATPGGIVPRYSLAAWWHTLVSLPLMLTLIFGWFWRLALWARLLWLISRLDLRLVASHPDHCAGLSFVGHSVRAFAVVALAFAAIVAGRSAYLVVTASALPTVNLYFNLGLMLAVIVLFVAPLLAFTDNLARIWRRGTLEHGALASQIGSLFERKWLDARNADQTAFEKPDFSATADLYSIVTNVHAIRFVPVDLKDLIPLIAAMLLPFVPVLLLAVPVDVLWGHIKSLLL
jgi:hypothetical protein